MGLLKTRLITSEDALPGRSESMPLAEPHRIFGLGLREEPGGEVAYFGLGCFWGAERLFWKLPGVMNTAVGYQGGQTENPTYEEVCTGRTGHAETVKVVFDPSRISFQDLLKAFWEAHDPTQGMRQGNDLGTQYRSCLFPTTAAQLQLAETAKARYAASLQERNFGAVTTEIRLAPPFFFAEGYHQQYLDRHPNGYCGLRGTGVSCTLG